jgi:hypothetical protein
MTVSIVEYKTTATVSGMGEMDKELVVLETGVKGRVTNNKDFDNNEKIDKFISTSTHIWFFDINTNLVAGRYIKTDDGEMFNIKYVNKRPGGKSDSHYQVYCILSNIQVEV